jgi:Ca2+/H+ antiporter, TMEM165/GDT1 family
MAAFLASFIFVLLAEMGDKTQLLAMAFACCYGARNVLIAVLLATLLNHAFAVGVGHFLSTVIPFGLISIAAAFSFVIFGLWTLHGDKVDEDCKRASRFGPIVTVGIAFFIAEMGDKTQLATVSLAAQYRNMLSVLLGTTLAMVTADAIGIVAGVLMRKHIPEQAVKFGSACVFILFGFIGAFGALLKYFELVWVWWILSFAAVVTAWAAFRILRSENRSQQ